MNRVYYTDLTKDELIDFRQTLEWTAISIANENADFICSQCLKTLKKLLDTISLFMKEDKDFEDLCDEIYEICGFEY